MLKQTLATVPPTNTPMTNLLINQLSEHLIQVGLRHFSCVIRNSSKRLVDIEFERIQLSVFCGLENPKNTPLLWAYLEKCINEKEDKVYVLKVSKASLMREDILGILDLDLEYLVADKHSLFF